MVVLQALKCAFISSVSNQGIGKSENPMAIDLPVDFVFMVCWAGLSVEWDTVQTSSQNKGLL